MRSAVNRARKSESGFTLIELLIVIVILGILAAIVVFSVRGITDKGTKSACQTSVATVDTAFEALVAQTTGALPTTAGTSVASLYPNYLHSDPTGTVIAGVTVTADPGGTKVSAIDTAATTVCP